MRDHFHLHHWPWLLVLILFARCQPEDLGPTSRPKARETVPRGLSIFGKIRDHQLQESILEPIPFDSIPPPLLSASVVEALKYQFQLLNYDQAESHRIAPDLTIERIDLIKTVYYLLKWQHSYPIGLKDDFQLFRLQGEDQRTNVLFTGYFSPVLKVSQTPTEIYRHPIYQRPRNWEGPLPTRRQIEKDGALDSLDLIIGWAANKLDVYLMQIQGSGYVTYPDGNIGFFAYDGTNQHPYRSMEKFLRNWEGPKPASYALAGIKEFFTEHPELVDTVLFQNPSYTFFKLSRGQPHGAGSVPLTPEISIAVDRRYIPLGSCLIAAIPVYDKRKRRVTGHEYRFLLAQDVGGGIRGPGHVDLYMGTGEEAMEKASTLKHYGQLYLILPKK